ncbi:MAG: diguanylate cyclase domain-containing protein, partial [Rubrivivax sp.]
LRQQVPDIVVLDAMMPGLNGFDTCLRMRAMPGFEHVPVLMLTGLDDDESINHAYRVGATDFFVKSPQWSLLDGRLRYLLRASHTRQELLRSRARLARAQDLARMGSFEWHPVPGLWEGRLELSAEALRVFGLSQGSGLGLRQLIRMVPRSERQGILRMLMDLKANDAVLATDIGLDLPDGRRRVVHVEAEPERLGPADVMGYTGVVQDVTDRRTAEDKIRHLANFDALTGLPNRRQLLWRTERALEHARRNGHLCALLLIDLDRFKVINDTLGHAAGDELLTEVARRLRSCVRHSDQVMESSVEAGSSRAHRTLEAVGRLGGDEFVALLPEVATEHDAERVAARILEAMRLPIQVAGQECFVTASVGVALFPRDGQN